MRPFAFLNDANPNASVRFWEDMDRDNKYALGVATSEPGLLRRLARACGCPPAHLPGRTDTEFEAGDRWHGNGRVNLRDFADSLMLEHGGGFDVTFSVAELARHECVPPNVGPSKGNAAIGEELRMADDQARGERASARRGETGRGR